VKLRAVFALKSIFLISGDSILREIKITGIGKPAFQL